jgi:Fur family ferric uptake transcriptional regulator
MIIIIMNAMDEARSRFEEYLRGKGLRLTAQRGLILDVFLGREGHMTPEELYKLVGRRDRSVGQATVYRALKLLVKSGMAREVDFGDGVMRYEHGFGHKHHDHLICLRCRKSIEVLDPAIEALQERLARKHGFGIRGHRMDIFGICAECGKEKG